MTSNAKSIRAYIIVLATVAVFFYIIVVIIAVTGIQSLSSDIYWAETSIERNNEVQDIRLSFEKTKRLSDNLFFHAGGQNI